MNKKCRKITENNSENNQRLSLKRNIECKCPKCQKVFYRNMIWTGRLPARKFCDECLVTNKNYFDNTYSINFT